MSTIKHRHFWHATEESYGREMVCSACGACVNADADWGRFTRLVKQPCSMLYKPGNLLKYYGSGWYIAHCISLDCALGTAGNGKIIPCVARTLDERLGIRQTLLGMNVPAANKVGDCVLTQRVFNLITKDRYWEKPTYDTLRKSLENLVEQACEIGIKRIAMPKIGSGLDRLDFDQVRDILNAVFANTDVEVHVCYLPNNRGGT